MKSVPASQKQRRQSVSWWSWWHCRFIVLVRCLSLRLQIPWNTPVSSGAGKTIPGELLGQAKPFRVHEAGTSCTLAAELWRGNDAFPGTMGSLYSDLNHFSTNQISSVSTAWTELAQMPETWVMRRLGISWPGQSRQVGRPKYVCEPKWKTWKLKTKDNLRDSIPSYCAYCFIPSIRFSRFYHTRTINLPWMPNWIALQCTSLTK